MKKIRLVFASIALIAAALCSSSCATLQQDVFTSSEENSFIYSSIEVYENQFIKLDAQNCLESQAPVAEVNKLLSEIATYKSTTKVTEPFLLARLRAFEGLLYKMLGKTKEAATALQEAKGHQKGDRYVQLLSSRMEKTLEASLTQIESVLAVDSRNAVLQLEKAKIYYKTNKFAEAIAAMDNAFILFDSEGSKDYREAYSELRANAWEMNKITEAGDVTVLDGTNLQQELTVEKLVELTVENTTLLDNYKSTKKQKASVLVSALEKGGYFSAPVDASNQELSSADILGNNPNVLNQKLNRKLCARFIWNAYIKKTGNLKMLARYSEKYQKTGRNSPIADVSIDDKDFDAVLGVIENEFMELPDGRNFLPEDSVTNLQFLTWIKKADK